MQQVDRSQSWDTLAGSATAPTFSYYLKSVAVIQLLQKGINSCWANFYIANFDFV